MPFGPAPAPAEMQSYVHRKFGLLRDVHGKEFVTPLMDDIFISSPDFETHKAHCHIVFSQARAAGFEFKVKKGNFNKEKIGLWGSYCSASGVTPDVKKVKQLEQWPEPDDRHKIVSFLMLSLIHI